MQIFVLASEISFGWERAPKYLIRDRDRGEVFTRHHLMILPVHRSPQRKPHLWSLRVEADRRR
jgi:hypothetical protein